MPKLQPHTFQGRSDRWCEICNLPDRNSIHQPRPIPPEVLRLHPKMLAFRDAASRLIAAHVGTLTIGDLKYTLVPLERYEELCDSFAALTGDGATEATSGTEGEKS